MKGQSNKKIGKVIYQSQLREAIQSCVLVEMKRTISCLISTNKPSYLRKTLSDNLATFNFDSFICKFS